MSALPPAVAGKVQHLDGPEGRIALCSAGEGPPVLLVHSVNAAASIAEMRPVFEHLARDHSVVALDLPGFGLSDRSDRPYTARLMTDAVARAMDWVSARHGGQAIDVVALSLGCEFAARAAVEQPGRVARLVLISPTGFRGSKSLRGPDGSTLFMPGFDRALRGPGWGGFLFRQLTRPGVIRYFLQRAWGGRTIDEELWSYCCLTTRVPGAEHAPLAFLGGKGPPASEPMWNGTLITDQYAGYNGVLDAQAYPQRKSAACAAHARRRFEELSRGGHSASAVATEAMLRWTRIYRAEAAFVEMSCDERRHARQVLSRPLWEEFEVWLRLQRTQVPEGTKIAEAIDYTLNAWKALTLHLDDGAVPIDNNLIERQIKPWKLGAKNWLFAGSALAGQRAAVVMSLVQSAKLNGLDPWAYLRDVLARIHTHPNNRLDELLPHRWRPA